MPWSNGGMAHNAVAFFPDRRLGDDVHYLPVRAGRPIFSYRLRSSASGESLLLHVGGSHHLHHTALPHWVQTLGMTFSVMLLVPSWSSPPTRSSHLNGAWHKVRDDATLRFMMVAAVFWPHHLQGSFMAIRAVNSCRTTPTGPWGTSAGALGWSPSITFGAIYAAVPKI